jgi:hypothetical protein
MYKGRSKLLPIVLVVIVAVVAIIALVSLGRALLNRSDRAADAEYDQAEQSLLVSEIDRAVRMTVRGPIIADENFNSYEITVSPTERIIFTSEGYENRTLKTERFENNTEAYEEFVHALAKANFSEATLDSEEIADVRGVCAQGRLYTFDMLQAQSTISTAWVASCRGGGGSFRGDAILVRDLFHKQIPEINDYLRDLNL